MLQIYLKQYNFSHSLHCMRWTKFCPYIKPKREIHPKNPDLLFCFLFTVVFCDFKKSVFSAFACLKKKKHSCVGRESNPGQLLGRQLCSPLYHRREVDDNSLYCHFCPTESYPLQWSTCLINKLQTNTVNWLFIEILVKIKIVVQWVLLLITDKISTCSSV